MKSESYMTTQKESWRGCRSYLTFSRSLSLLVPVAFLAGLFAPSTFDSPQGAARGLTDQALVTSTIGPDNHVAPQQSVRKLDAVADESTLREFELEIARSPVVGGAPVSSGEMPWMTSLLIKTPTGFSQCGGSLIAPLWVLTAAHCVDDALLVRTITGRITYPTSIDDPDFVIADKLYINDGYDPKSFGVFDVALVQLSQPSPAPPLYLANSDDSRLYTEGTQATVAGWGLIAEDGSSSDILLAGDMPIQSVADCISADPEFDPAFNLCAGYRSGKALQPVGSCSGDSGGPLLVPSGDMRTRVQVGIVSYGFGSCTSLNKPGYYMRVAALYEWVDDVVGGLPASPTDPPLAFEPVGPERVIDTRLSGGALTAGSTLTVPVGSQYAGKSISVNLTTTAAVAGGYATLYECDRSRPATSSLNYRVNQAIANGVITKVSAEGTVCVYVSESTQVILDVSGVFPTESAFEPVGPERVIDTRLSGGALTAGSTLTVPVGSQYAGKSISVNLTTTAAVAGGYATLYECDRSRPATSSLNYRVNQAIANGVITKVSAEGTVCVYVSESTQVILDVSGVFPTESDLKEMWRPR